MKKNYLLFSFLLAGCTVMPRIPAGHVIADRDHVAGPDYWKPSEAEVAPLEASLALLLARPDRRVSSLKGARLSDYVIKYYGKLAGTTKVIVGEASHVSERSLQSLQQENSTPDVAILLPFGGGSAFFTVVYDTKRKSIPSVTGNAPL